MKLLPLLCLLLLAACASNKTANHPITVPDTSENPVVKTDKENSSDPETKTIIPESYNVKIIISHTNPYCGGAYPTEEVLANRTRVQANTSFILINLESKEKTKVVTDATGTLYLDLPNGKYAIQELYKDCTLEEFKKQNPPPSGQYYRDNPDPSGECYKTWWESNLGQFEITKNTPDIQMYNWGTSDACFTGNNPCIYYNGPYPP